MRGEQADPYLSDIINQYGGLDLAPIERVENLKFIKSELQKDNDPCRELPNVNSIIEAYLNGDIPCDGSVTYWAQGKLLLGPTEFSWEKFYELNTEENRQDGGFWVEGVSYSTL